MGSCYRGLLGCVHPAAQWDWTWTNEGVSHQGLGQPEPATSALPCSRGNLGCNTPDWIGYMHVCVTVCTYVFIYLRLWTSVDQPSSLLQVSGSAPLSHIMGFVNGENTFQQQPQWSHVEQSPKDIGNYILTPPTFSKNPPWLPKCMSCSLKNQVNLSSSDGSWLTWHGRTMLSPTVTSSVDGSVVIMVGSETNSYTPESAKNQKQLMKVHSCACFHMFIQTSSFSRVTAQSRKSHPEQALPSSLWKCQTQLIEGCLGWSPQKNSLCFNCKQHLFEAKLESTEDSAHIISLSCEASLCHNKLSLRHVPLPTSPKWPKKLWGVFSRPRCITGDHWGRRKCPPSALGLWQEDWGRRRWGKGECCGFSMHSTCFPLGGAVITW